MTLVKICGICDAAGGVAAVEAGADLLGFHFCSSLRRVEPEAALAVIRVLPRRPQLVGVFINQSPVEMRQIADHCGLDWVQLHGSEAPGLEAPRPVIKALKVGERGMPDASAWPDPILLDSWSADERGGTGRSWDWDRARELVASRQVFLAGGLNPSNVAEAIDRLHPHGVDVSSGVESAPRVKDAGLVRALVKMVRMAETGEA